MPPVTKKLMDKISEQIDDGSKKAQTKKLSPGGLQAFKSSKRGSDKNLLSKSEQSFDLSISRRSSSPDKKVSKKSDSPDNIEEESPMPKSIKEKEKNKYIDKNAIVEVDESSITSESINSIKNKK